MLGPAPLYSQEGWSGTEAIVWTGQPDTPSFRVYQGAEVGQENHTKWSHIRVPGLVDQEALQSPGALCHEEGCRPPESSTHRGRAAAEHSSE